MHIASGFSFIRSEQYATIRKTSQKPQVQHEHGLTLGQRLVYFCACLANTAAMLTTTLVFVMAILLPCATYVGRYHIMLLVILGAAVLGVATLVSVGLALAGLDTSLLSADRWVWFKEYINRLI